jgi:polysaccharide pyruvyl transferase WcaK-like protein
MRVIFLNTHSLLNSGDAGIVLAQIQFLKRHFSNLKISLTSRTPDMDQKFYGAEGIKVYPPLIPAPSVYRGKKQKVRHSLENLFSFQSKRNLLKEIKDCDLVISSGGGYFWSPRKILPGPMFFQNCIHLWLASVMRKPIILFPQSVGPLSNQPSLRLLKNILDKKTILKIFVREATSFDFLTHLLKKNRDKIEVCPDMAFCMQKNDIQESSHTISSLSKPIVGITLRQWSFPEIASKKEREKKRKDYLAHLDEACGKIFNHWKGSIVILCQ